MARARRLKVFQAQIGFYDTVVAVPSQPAALKAWGLRQDLFASGHAKLAEDPEAVAAAMAQPDTPLKRPVGTCDPFVIETARLPKVGAAAGKSKSPLAAPKRASPKPVKPPADRTRLDALESELGALHAARAREEADLMRRKERLEAEIAEARATHAEALKAAKAAIADARAAYRKAGGQT
ncbi:MAG: hypothetical protein Q8R71_06465 [Phenylobacterium sp.]|nr:hypothetical protein [Phenylobacterium sp.]